MEDFNNINIWNKRLDSQENLFEYLNWLLINYEIQFGNEPYRNHIQTDYLKVNTKNCFIEAFSLLDFNKIKNLTVKVDNGAIFSEFEYEDVEITLEVYWSVYIIIFAEDTYIKYYERKEYKYLNKTIQEKLIDYNYVK